MHHQVFMRLSWGVTTYGLTFTEYLGWKCIQEMDDEIIYRSYYQVCGTGR